MKRTQERAPRTKKKLNLRVEKNGKTFVGITVGLLALLTLIVTTSPRYMVKNEEIVSVAHNHILNVNIPIGYFWFSLLVGACVAPLAIYGLGFGDRHTRDLKSLEKTFDGLFMFASVVGCLSALFLPFIFSMGIPVSKAEAALTEYVGNHKASESLKLGYEIDSNKLTSFVVNVNKGSNNDDYFLDTAFGATDSGYDVENVIFNVVDKGGKYYLVGAPKWADNMNDLVEYGELSKEQVNKFSKLVEKY